MQVRIFYTVYKITNLINGKIYIGLHQTMDLDDGYLGSGLNIRRAIEKYGSENFKKEYIAIFDENEKMYDLEKQLVNEEFIKRTDVYNINIGGDGGWFYVNKNFDKELRRKICQNANKAIPLKTKKRVGKEMGDVYGGKNKLSDEEVINRLKQIEDINLMEFGWVSKVSKRLNITHTQTRRFIKKHYKGEYYQRNAPVS